MQDLMAWMIELLLLDPLQTRLAEQLLAAQAPTDLIAQVEECARIATPLLVDRIKADPLWATQTAMRIWVGVIPPEITFADAVPACRPLIEAAEPFLSGPAA